MNRRIQLLLPLVALGGLCFSLAAPGCGGSSSKPTKTIRLTQPGEAQPATFTSVPGYLPTGAPAAATEFQLKPFSQWSESQAAADALGRIGPPAVPQLIEALRSGDPQVQLPAIQVLARMGSSARDATGELIRLLDSPEERIRKTAARTLGRIGPEAGAAVPALMRSLLQPEPVPPPQ